MAPDATSAGADSAAEAVLGVERADAAVKVATLDPIEPSQCRREYPGWFAIARTDGVPDISWSPRGSKDERD